MARPTIAELEKVLDNPNAEVEVGPDGSLVSSEFRKELESLLNRHNKEGGSNTPDFILSQFLIGCLTSFDAAVNRRADWYGRHDVPGQS